MINFCFMVKRSFLLLTTIVECSFRFKMIYIFYISIRAQRSWMYLSLLDDLHQHTRHGVACRRWMYLSFLDDLHRYFLKDDAVRLDIPLF